MLSKYPILGFEDGLPTRLILTGLSNLYGDNFVGSFHSLERSPVLWYNFDNVI